MPATGFCRGSIKGNAPLVCIASRRFDVMNRPQLHAIGRHLPIPAAERVVPAAGRDALPKIVSRYVADDAAERAALVDSLSAVQASIPPKYFYDPLGCALFGAICALPEYYPTRTEAAIFRSHRAEIARALGTGKQLIDLGAGDCAKSRAWLPWLAPRRVVAVDIAAQAITAALTSIAPEHPGIEFTGVVTDFMRGLDLHADLASGPVTFFYPGSSIGNFDRAGAGEFLASIAAHCQGRADSGLLIGVDMKKDTTRLVAAYDDPGGVTAAFNRNVLNHVNRALGADFAPREFIHRALYDTTEGRIEMHLEAATPQVVHFAGRKRAFAAGERIHTENSYKYTPGEFTRMLNVAGFERVWCWQDEARDFGVFYAH
jgi:dimethylhistidine N-methyltransferase